MMTITGDWDDKEWYGDVLVDGVKLDPKPSQKLRNHSPDGFAWGYPGSGPAQLALAILLRAGLPAEEAIHHYQDFKREFIQGLPRDGGFTLKVDVNAWMAARRSAGINFVVVNDEARGINYRITTEMENIALAVGKDLAENQASQRLGEDWWVFIEVPGDRPTRYTVGQLIGMWEASR
jgi:hypothetical protein